MGELIFVGVMFVIAMVMAPILSHQEKKNKENAAKIIEASSYKEVTEDDVQHEYNKSMKEAAEYKRWLEEKRMAETRMRTEAIARQAEKLSQECAQETERMNNPNNQSKRILKPSIYLFPIMLAVASLFDMPSWLYTLFKIIVLIEAIILIGIRLNDGKFRSEKVAIGTVYMAFMAAIGILSFTNGGFPKSFWVILDIGYCIMHVLIYLGFVEGENRDRNSH